MNTKDTNTTPGTCVNAAMHVAMDNGVCSSDGDVNRGCRGLCCCDRCIGYCNRCTACVSVDINGVLADVRKLSWPRLERKPDLVLHNGQPVYFRKTAGELVRALSELRRDGVLVGIWTSRRHANAVPIVDAIRRRYQFEPDFLLTGEQCLAGSAENPYKLRKAAVTLRMQLGAKMGGASVPLVFVDDNAGVVEASGEERKRTTVVSVPSFRAERIEEDELHVDDVFSDVATTIIRMLREER